jgi:hypothetical protein
MLVDPPREGFFRSEFWNLEAVTRLAVRRKMYLVRIPVIDPHAHDIEVNHCAQLAREKLEELFRRAN